MAMNPTTTHVMNIAAPINCPIAKLGELIFIASNVENTSGDAFPNANNVTPAKLSDIFNNLANVSKFGHRNSDAVIPKLVNNITRIKISSIKLGHFLF
ncbi:hypothetical protein WICMUC_004248 [Wickerhamomyces mucosus]|uniref:Uncharacterized protein n=1 Tax=Wickerhamomyces mucosus TaxID=1378264 RepID=A0A9P8PIF9_9ASCO|nr:hypothetical protein WICMUC_004248 [Wickerhamomyces mucosus]